MISTLLSDPTFVNWFGILLLTTMMVSFNFVFHGVNYFSKKMRTIFLCIGIASMLSLLALLIFKLRIMVTSLLTNETVAVLLAIMLLTSTVVSSVLGIIGAYQLSSKTKTILNFISVISFVLFTIVSILIVTKLKS